MAIKVDNMEEAIAYLKGKGVEISVEPVSLPGGSKRAEIKDPDGLGIEPGSGERRWQPSAKVPPGLCTIMNGA